MVHDLGPPCTSSTVEKQSASYTTEEDLLLWVGLLGGTRVGEETIGACEQEIPS